MDVKTLVETYQTANPFTLAENLNIPFQYVDFPENLKGQIVVYDAKPIILLNDSIKETPATPSAPDSTVEPDDSENSDSEDTEADTPTTTTAVTEADTDTDTDKQ